MLTVSYPLIPTFGANTEREQAMEMRGVRFYAIDFNMYTTNRLLEGTKYRVEVPLYNASFQSANNVQVDLYWVADRTEKNLTDAMRRVGKDNTFSSYTMFWLDDLLADAGIVLSADTPMFWRINGVAQVINSSESNSNDVFISPANHTEEDFAISWNPEDSETVKTDSIELTISTIPGTTPLGNYGFRVETSEDGENW